MYVFQRLKGSNFLNNLVVKPYFIGQTNKINTESSNFISVKPTIVLSISYSSVD